MTTPRQQRALERFYYLEARFLGSRQYQQWLALVSQDIQYTIPARTNAQVNNRLSVVSNFHLYYARPSSESFVYSGQRRDVLIEQAEEGSDLILRREIILDYATIEAPTLGLLL